jgi:thymidylate kinase
MKRIILEGPDGSGKTQLGRVLANRFPQLILVDGFKHQTQEKVYENWVFQQLLYDPVDRIPMFDRLYYSEIVYGMALRAHVDVMPHAQRQIEQHLRTTSFMIYCSIPLPELQSSAARSPQMEGVLDNLPIIHEQYERLMMDEYRYYGPRRFQHYDYTQNATEQGLMDKLEMYLG